MAAVYTLRRDARTLSVRDAETERDYVVGIRSVYAARRAQYHLGTEPRLVLERATRPSLSSVYGRGTLLIPLLPPAHRPPPAAAGHCWGFHLVMHRAAEFYQLPLKQNLGIALAYELVAETDAGLTFRVHLLEPFESPRHFREGLQQRRGYPA